MSDQTNQNNNSYVDSYAPPQTPPYDQSGATANQVPPMQMSDSEVVDEMPTASTPTPMPATDSGQGTSPAVSVSPVSQTLEDQNIFTLLGVDDISDKEKEEFLDELQQVIWEDFIENDVQLLITETESAELKKIMEQTFSSDLDKREAIVVYLEKLIPDLEEIMLEKALELKQEMMLERLKSMRDMFASDPDKLKAIDQAESLTKNDQWRDAAAALNSLT